MLTWTDLLLQVLTLHFRPVTVMMGITSACTMLARQKPQFLSLVTLRVCDALKDTALTCRHLTDSQIYILRRSCRKDLIVLWE